jgi:hypothetical protein
VLCSKLGIDETAQRQALRQDLAHGRREPVGAVARSDTVVLRDQSADRHAREPVEERQDHLPHRPADVLELHVDALRASGS